jgi:hypothetical protein
MIKREGKEDCASATNQTPFERFSASLKQVLSVSKQDLPQLAKKSKKQK